jgi:DNA-binding transcriptional ArsR family regulator
MQEKADQATDLLKALANRNRLMILCMLSSEELSVGEIAKRLDLRDTVVSQHLALLRKDGLVQSRRDAQTMYYSLAANEARRIIDVLYELYCDTDDVERPKTTVA